MSIFSLFLDVSYILRVRTFAVAIDHLTYFWSIFFHSQTRIFREMTKIEISKKSTRKTWTPSKNSKHIFIVCRAKLNEIWPIFRLYGALQTFMRITPENCKVSSFPLRSFNKLFITGTYKLCLL